MKAKLAAATQGRRGAGANVLTASYQGDRLRLVAVMAPQSAAPAEIVRCQETPAGFVLKVKRGDLVDLVAVGPTPDAEGEIKSDAEAAVVTLKDGKAVKAMIVAGTSLAAGDATLRFNQSSSALADAAGGKLTLSAPLGQKAGAVSCAAGGLAIRSANGQAIPAGAVEFQVTALGWKELQDKLLDSRPRPTMSLYLSASPWPGRSPSSLRAKSSSSPTEEPSCGQGRRSSCRLRRTARGAR